MERLKIRLHGLLRWSEKFFKTDMVYLAKGGSWLAAGQAISTLASFVLAVGFAHFLSKDTYGTYKYIMSVGSIIAAFSLTGLSTAVTNAIARGQDGTLKLSFKKNLKWGSLTLVIFAAVAFYYFLHGNTLLASGLLIIGIATPLLGSASLADSFLIGKKDFKRSALTSSVAILLVNTTTLLTAFLTHNILALIGVYMLSSLVIELAIYLYAIKIYSPLNLVADPDAISYGAHLSIMGILGIFVDKLDSILTFHFLGPIELAIYSFAIAMPEQLKGILKNASVLALPKFSRGNTNAMYHSMKRKMVIMTTGISVIIVLYILSAPLLFKVLFPQYAGRAVLLSQIYVITILPSAAVLPITFLQALGAKKELYLFNTLTGVFQIMAMTIGTLKLGLIGLIISVGLSRGFRFVYSLILVRNAHRDANTS